MRAISVLSECALELGLVCHVGVIASGDRFVAATEDKARIVADFDASVCEMEGAAIAQVAFVNDTPFCVIRSVSDSADEGSSMDYLQFLPIAADASAKLTEKLCQKL